ncbi:hypothetical protein GLOIN_2v1770383 [Rhizophagus clarus]|uniref:Uncharacterized protein n=1 Tax=Rhizophagus clarus TaxID=94130 RepID=A0A8H3L1F3_9GLOM|nr:hypothetical protein GLOIN_2v1770383 [Rhizophagus clarus]
MVTAATKKIKISAGRQLFFFFRFLIWVAGNGIRQNKETYGSKSLGESLSWTTIMKKIEEYRKKLKKGKHAVDTLYYYLID